MQQTEVLNKFDGVRPPGTPFAGSHHHTENSAAEAVLDLTDPELSLISAKSP